MTPQGIPVAPGVRDPVGKPVLLLVDDQTSLLTILTRALERRGYEVLQAIDVPSAIAVLTTHRDRLTLILSDVEMPGPPIERFLAEVAKSERRIPVILMSGEVVGADARVPALLSAADALLDKPFRLQAMYELLERVLENRSSR